MNNLKFVIKDVFSAIDLKKKKDEYHYLKAYLLIKEIKLTLNYLDILLKQPQSAAKLHYAVFEQIIKALRDGVNEYVLLANGGPF